MLTQAPACGRLPVCVLCVWLLGPPWPPKWGFPLPVARETNRSATTPGKGLEERVPEPHAPVRSGKGGSGVPLHPPLSGAQQTRVGPEAGAARGRAARGVSQDRPFGAKTGTVGLPTRSSDFCGSGGALFKNRVSYKRHTCTLVWKQAGSWPVRQEGSEALPASLHDQPAPVPSPCEPPLKAPLWHPGLRSQLGK